MMNTVASLLSLLTAVVAPSPPQSVADTVVRDRAAERAHVARPTEDVDIVSDAPAFGRARSLRDLARVRVVLSDGDSIIDGPAPSRALGLRELVAARLVLDDGELVTDGFITSPARANGPRASVAHVSWASGVTFADLGPAIP